MLLRNNSNLMGMVSIVSNSLLLLYSFICLANETVLTLSQFLNAHMYT